MTLDNVRSHVSLLDGLETPTLEATLITDKLLEGGCCLSAVLTEITFWLTTGSEREAGAVGDAEVSSSTSGDGIKRAGFSGFVGDSSSSIGVTVMVVLGVS
jgi:hypothetical protein